MPKPFDVTAKERIERDPRAWLELVLDRKIDSVRVLSTDLATVTTQADSTILVEGDALSIAPKPVERLVRRIGQERIDQRDKAVAVLQRLPLIAKDSVAHPQRSCPQVAMVSIDGGRLQVRSDPSKPKSDSHWKESKVAVLETYQSAVHEADPDPHLPRCFLDLKRTKEMVRGLGQALPVG